MQLRRVRVRNIRSYVHGEVHFPPGTTLLSGDVGAGKTSLLYAIEMALFGIAEVDAAYLVRHNAPHAEVDVELEDAEHRYRISRRFRRVNRRGKTSFEPEKIAFRVDGAETTYSATELRQRVIEILGFPDNPNPQAHSDLWRWAVYVPQERMRDILAARPQDRLETVRKALGVERYRTAAENAQELATDLRRSMNGRRQEAERLRHFDLEHSEATAETDRLSLERHALETSVAERRAQVVSAQEGLAAAEAAVRQNEADKRELSSLEREQAADERLLADLVRTRTERLEEVARREREAEAARAEASERTLRRARLEEAERQRNAARVAVDGQAELLRTLAAARAEHQAALRRERELELALGRAERDRADFAREFAALEKEGPGREPPAPTSRSLREIDEALRAAQAAEAEALAELTRGRSTLGELEELLKAGVCPRCHQAVQTAEFSAHRAESESEVAAQEAAHRARVAAREQVEEERRARERYERALDRWKEVAKRRASAATALARAEEALRGATETLAAARTAGQEAAARVESLAPAEAEETRLRVELSHHEEEVTRRRTELERAAGAAERERTAQGALEALRSEIDRLDREFGIARDRSSQRADRLSTLRTLRAGAAERDRDRSEAERRLAAQTEALARERDIAARVEARLEEAGRRMRAAEKGRAERAALLEEANDLERKAAWVGGPFRTTLLSMEQKLLSHAQVLFERNFARYFSSLIEDPALVARTDVAFTPAVTIEGEWTPAEALSGGERTSLALAFRLALAQVVRRLGGLHLETILLDEPTDGFSPEQVVRMGELLDELALPQVVIVSHESELSGIADWVVRIEKHDGASVLAEPGKAEPAGPSESEPAESPPAGTRPRRRRPAARALTESEP